MAVVDDEKESKIKSFGLEALEALANELGEVNIDVTADPYDYPPPPLWNVYLMQFNPASKDPFVQYEDGGVAYKIDLKMAEKEFASDYPATVGYSASGSLRQGQAISTGANILVKAGYKLESGSMQVAKVLKGVHKFCTSDKNVLPVELDWKGYSSRKEKTVVYGMCNFTKGENGMYLPSVTIDGEEIRARAYVTRIYPRGSDLNVLRAEIKKKIEAESKGKGGIKNSKSVVGKDDVKDVKKGKEEVIVDESDFGLD